ncbi:hypothetical protein, partial [Acidaminobacter sp.]|uniref:hypothetical protein n=1 Tax=Acidaminobacter sp. TaxID=1872102 RepID=UPI0025C2094B
RCLKWETKLLKSANWIQSSDNIPEFIIKLIPELYNDKEEFVMNKVKDGYILHNRGSLSSTETIINIIGQDKTKNMIRGIKFR